jgi:hypothetical protein
VTVGARVVVEGADIVCPSHIAVYGVITAMIVPACVNVKGWRLTLNMLSESEI